MRGARVPLSPRGGGEGVGVADARSLHFPLSRPTCIPPSPAKRERAGVRVPRGGSPRGGDRRLHRGDRRPVVLRAEDRAAGDERVGARLRDRTDVVDLHAAVDLE